MGIKPIDTRSIPSDVGLAEGLVDNLLHLSLKLRNKPGKYTHFPRNGSSPSVVDQTFTRGRPEVLSGSLVTWLGQGLHQTG